MRILFASGGTGGHILPVIAVKKELDLIAQAKGLDMEYLLVGDIDKTGELLLQDAGIPFHKIYAGKIRRYFSINNFFDIFRGIWGVILSQWYIWQFMPDVTFGKGGYASVPGTLVSWMYQVPILIHESDTIPGIANRFLGRFANVVSVGFPGAKVAFGAEKTSVVGNMTHPDIQEGSRDAAGKIFNLTFDKPILLVVGGSQGAMVINEVIWQLLPQLIGQVEIIHVVGRNNERKANKVFKSLDTYQSRFYHYAGFLNDELKHAYAVADLVISRSGASSIADLSLTGKPSILIPITVDAGQQRSNAYEVASIGGALVMEEANFTPNLVLTKIEELLRQPNILDTMGTNVRQLASPDAARRIAEELIQIAL